jgi:hypothetical protein
MACQHPAPCFTVCLRRNQRVNHLTNLLIPAELTVFSLEDAGQAKNRDFTRFV